jgi:hypothetical protein
MTESMTLVLYNMYFSNPFALFDLAMFLHRLSKYFM